VRTQTPSSPYTPKNENRFAGPLLFFLPIVEKYLEELENIVSTKDHAILRQWSERKRSAQSKRVEHSALCEYWSTHWMSNRSEGHESYIPELFIILLLSSALVLLWNGPITSFALWPRCP